LHIDARFVHTAKPKIGNEHFHLKIEGKYWQQFVTSATSALCRYLWPTAT